MSGGFGGGGFSFGAPATTSSTVTFGTPATFGTAATQQTNLPTFGSTAAVTNTGFGNLQQQQPAQTGGLFNLNSTANTTQNVTQQPSSNTGFGFSFGGASQPAKTTAPVFGSTATSAAPSTAATGFGTGNLFSTASTTTNATQSLTQTPQANTFGNLTTTSAAAPTSTPAFSLNLTQPTQTNSLLNNTTTQNLTSSAPTNQSLTTSTAAKPASTGFNFGSTGTTTTQTTSSTNQATSTTSNASLSIPQSTSTTLASSTTATAQQSTQQPQQPPQMTFKQLEGYINVWLNELNQMEKDFQTQSQTINSWDSLLVNNGIKISNVNENLDVLKEEHKRIDQQLDFVISQQNELEQLLEPLEKTQVDFNINDTASTEREFTYSLVDTVSSDLLGIGTELQNFIKKLNETKANQDANDPLSSIGKILNSHLDALQYIEHQINVLKKNIDS